MKKLKEIVELLRSFFPKVHNRLASAIVYAGIALILGPPLIEKLINFALGIAIDTQLTEYDQVYGLILVLWGSIYHVLMTKLSEISSSVRSSKKYEARATLIKECRGHLQVRDFDRREFVETDVYSRLRPFLSEKLVSNLEKNARHLTIRMDTARGGGVDNFESDILDELTALEQQWGLL